MKKMLRIALFIFTILCYGSVLISPARLWILGFFSLAIPLILFIHLILLVLHIPRFRKSFYYHLAAIVFGFAFIKVTYSISSNDDGGNVKVLSYNVRVFNNYAHLRNKGFISSKKMIRWAVENDAAIKCFQEYYNHEKSDIFNVRKQLTAAGWGYNHSHIVLRDRDKAEFGTAIFSKYPIIKEGEINSESGEFLNSIFADILIGDDTIRIYNTHLESMSINEDNIINTDKLANSYKDTGYRLRRGFMSRAKQIDALAAHIRRSPHRVILCGDLNEVPYSYVYFALRRLLNNAFEKAGNGFGFTYNGKLFFLRIDNQFFGDKIKIHSFSTHRKVDYSDHFPLTAIYSW